MVSGDDKAQGVPMRAGILRKRGRKRLWMSEAKALSCWGVGWAGHPTDSGQQTVKSPRRMMGIQWKRRQGANG